jgi:NTE family protein
MAPTPAPTPEVAFVLGGGGRWGAVEVGMLQALDAAGVRPDLVLGTSIGAVNGASYAANPSTSGLHRLERLWRELSQDDVLGSEKWRGQAKRVLRLESSLVDPTPLRTLLTEHLGTERIEELDLPFQCVAASIERAAEHWFTTGPLVDAIMASAAVPALFPPVEVGGEHFYDGGLVNSVPISRAVELGASTIYVLQVGRVEQRLEPPTRLHQAAVVAFEISRRHRFSTALQALPDGVSVHLLPSANELDPTDRRQLQWSDLSRTAELIDAARDATADYLAGLG